MPQPIARLRTFALVGTHPRTPESICAHAQHAGPPEVRAAARTQRAAAMPMNLQ
jgi:hypothetical protein